MYIYKCRAVKPGTLLNLHSPMKAQTPVEYSLENIQKINVLHAPSSSHHFLHWLFAFPSINLVKQHYGFDSHTGHLIFF